jgi:hypothetical protein
MASYCPAVAWKSGSSDRATTVYPAVPHKLWAFSKQALHDSEMVGVEPPALLALHERRIPLLGSTAACGEAQAISNNGPVVAIIECHFTAFRP